MQCSPPFCTTVHNDRKKCIFKYQGMLNGGFEFLSIFLFGFYLDCHIPVTFGVLVHKYASSGIGFCMQSRLTYMKLTGNFDLSLWWELIVLVVQMARSSPSQSPWYPGTSSSYPLSIKNKTLYFSTPGSSVSVYRVCYLFTLWLNNQWLCPCHSVTSEAED